MADPLGVSIAFDATWSDPAPVWTRIDTLAGCRVQEWTIDRGRPTEFDKTDTGTAVIRIVDRAGLFDPTNPGSPYTGKILPGKQAAIALQNPTNLEWHSLFRGYVESWAYRLDQTRQFMALELQLVDGFALLSRMELRAGQDGYPLPADGRVAAGNVFYENTLAGSVQTRINDILNDVGWPAGLREIFSGNVNLSEKIYGSGTTALEALQDAADGEFPGVANLYIDKTGVLVFHGRQPRFRPQIAEYGIQERDVGDPSGTSLDPDVVPLAELEWSLGHDNLINACYAYPEKLDDGSYDPDLLAAQYAKDDPSILTHGVRGVTFDSLQTRDGLATGNNALQETRLFADYYVANYKTPVPRISRMVFKTRRPGTANGDALWRHLCRCEISDLLNLKTAHPGGGGFDLTTDSFYVEGLHYEGRPLRPEYPNITLSLDVSPQQHYATNPFDADTDPVPAP